ncbi:galactose-1-phosphate uridylyltransferase [Roseiconus lacunae]|uniref:DUF4921 family protein n=2 Tax=Roseiconus lacunae TaxID=2605694 RepID=A0ABT7PGR3_9BACT|nr:DUF4921 family protein [Roseiconus lacunae]MDM4015484.1 DUF4921 family protein [Roseiconus lacunae]
MIPDADSDMKPETANSSAPDQVREAELGFAANRKTPKTDGPIDMDTRLSTDEKTRVMLSVRRSSRKLDKRWDVDPDTQDQLLAEHTWLTDESASHSRRDQLTGGWTIYAPSRDQRPNEYAPAPSMPPVALGNGQIQVGCPFCAGSEQQTPEAVWTGRLGDLTAVPTDQGADRFARPAVSVCYGEQPGWDVRVVPNKFPAITAIDPNLASLAETSTDQLFPSAPVVGGHEVIIESSGHAENMASFDPALVYLTLVAYRERIRHWASVDGIRYISVFKNCGPEAGASLHHSHSQLIATSLLPQAARVTLARCETHRARTGSSLGCDLLRAECEQKSRLIDRTDSFVAYSPFASRFPGMIRVTSMGHQSHFENFDDATLDRLASLLTRVIYWVDQAFPGKAYNYLLHTCPPAASQPEAFQWWLDIFPRINKAAGFEWSSDCMINSMLPEVAAANYRRIARKDDPRRVLAFG